MFFFGLLLKLIFNVAERYVVSLQVKRRFSHRNSSFLLLTLQRYKKIPRYASLSVIIFQIFFRLSRSFFLGRTDFTDNTDIDSQANHGVRRLVASA